jgi:hypothetical protein
VAVADFNADAVTDLATTVTTDVGSEVKVLLGAGNGAFKTAISFAADSADSVLVGSLLEKLSVGL